MYCTAHIESKRDFSLRGLSDARYYITFELAVGGELFDRIITRGKFTEKDAADCIR